MGLRGAFLLNFILAIVVTALIATPAQAEKRVALVIGNDQYPNLPADRQLLKAANDADAIGDALAKLGFTVIRGKNLGRQAMIERLAEFTAQLGPGDTAAFFYAGHGVAISGVNYLVPSDIPTVTADAESRVRGNSIAEGDIVAEIQNKAARVALLILDACRDNPFPRTGTRSIGNTRGLADARPARGIFTIYSAGIGQSALDRLEKNDPNRNSVFTRIFVQQLARTDLHLGELVLEVREKVADLALKARGDSGEPQPHEQTPAYYDQTIGGRIYLAGRSIGVVLAPKDNSTTSNPDDVAALRERLRALEEQLKKNEPRVAVVAPPPAQPPPGATSRGWLGVGVQPITDDIAKRLGIRQTAGTVIATIDQDGPAKLAGLEVDDVVIRFDGKIIKETTDLPTAVADTPAGKAVEVVIIRKGKEETRKVKLGRLEDNKSDAPKSTTLTPDKPASDKTESGQTNELCKDKFFVRFFGEMCAPQR